MFNRGALKLGIEGGGLPSAFLPQLADLLLLLYLHAWLNMSDRLIHLMERKSGLLEDKIDLLLH